MSDEIHGPAIFGLRPADELVRKYRADGVWRDVGPLDDLRRWRELIPDAPAVIAYRSGAGMRRLTYSEYDRYVERFAGALYELGVRPGHVVAIQLPNWWQLSALMLACVRVGAVVAPVMPTIGPRELERTLARVGASVCVTVDRWAGTDHAEALSKIAARLPRLRHRVVLGTSAPGSEVDFVRHFEETPWERRHPMVVSESNEDPDRGAVVLFTSGNSGEPKGVLHSFNTLHAGAFPVVEAEGLDSHDRIFTPQAQPHVFGMIYGVLIPLLAGGASVVSDVWRPHDVPEMLVDSEATVFAGAPSYLAALVAATENATESETGSATEDATGNAREKAPLRLVFSGATSVPGQLVSAVPRIWGVPLRTLWGMTEVPGHTWTRADDPPLWGAHSDGRPGSGLEIDFRPNASGAGETRETAPDVPPSPHGPWSPEQPARLFVRGGGVALATLGRDSGRLRVVAEHDDGWYDTGDLAIPDGRGGLRIISREVDRIGGTFMIPVNDVETELLNHPGVAEVALIGYPDGEGGELACAVVVPKSPTLTLGELREFLTDRGMTEWYQPSRLELIGSLPRNSIGKVLKAPLRGWLHSAGPAEGPRPEAPGAQA
ncbi:AMP-binding protein [Streptomyces liangshanensis]|uniref:AMP-binding protein n=1 Tax=Streptomyces liangshanensis TaxID=2717324 RepID=UPI0036D86E2F